MTDLHAGGACRMSGIGGSGGPSEGGAGGGAGGCLLHRQYEILDRKIL